MIEKKWEDGRMRKRTIVFTAPYTAELVRGSIAAPKKGEVQIKLAVSTISSGTERANIMGDPNVSISRARVTFPRILGYSSSGTVTALGAGVEGLCVGDRVALAESIHAEYVNLSESRVFKIPDEVSFEDAAIFYISTFPLAAIRKCRLEIGESAIVMGMGVLGLIAIALLKQAGAAPIIAVDPKPEKRVKALSIGADYALDPFSSDFAESVKKLTDGGANVGIEVTGVGAGLDGILDCMAKFGRVALLGCTRNKDFTIDYYRKVHAPGITLIGAHTRARPELDSYGGWWTQSDDVKSVIRLTALGRIKLSDLIEETHSPQEAPEIYARLVEDETFPFVQFDWRLL